MKKTPRHIINLQVILLAAALTAACRTGGAATPGGHLATERLEAICDSLLNGGPLQCGAASPGGLVIAVNQFGVFFQKACGLAVIDDRVPFDARGTILPAASISSLITAIAVMQLDERGHLDIGDDPAKYMENAGIELSFEQPVTIEELLTHTAGFEAGKMGSMAETIENIPSISEFVLRRMPKQSTMPGRHYIYSGYGMTLLALIVENASGIPFARYVRENITLPLEMHHSSFEADDSLVAGMMSGYSSMKGRGGRVALGPYFPTSRGASGMLTTGSDMANFMIACLNGGGLEGKRILDDRTLYEMFRRQFEYDQAFEPAMGFGWHTKTRNGVKSVFHRSSSLGAESLLLLYPWHGIGFFLIFNDNAAARFIDEFNLMADDIFMPHIQRIDIPVKEKLPVPDGITGSYVDIGVPSTTVEMVMAFVSSRIEVKETANGGLLIDGRPAALATQGIIEETASGAKWIYRRPDRQLISGLTVYRRQKWFEGVGFQITALVLCIVIFASSPALLSSGARVKEDGLTGTRPTFSHMHSITVSALNIIFCVAFITFMKTWRVEYGPTLSLKLLLTLPIVSTLLLLGFPLILFSAWTRSLRPLPVRIHISLIAAASILFAWLLNHWNLLGYNF